MSKTIITAHYSNPGSHDDHVQRRASFDLHLPPRVSELVGYGLLWELGLTPMPELVDVEVEHHDVGEPASDVFAPVQPESDDDIQLLTIDASEVARRGITWSRFVTWSGDPRLSVDKPPRDWQHFIACHVFGAARVVGCSEWSIYADIATTTPARPVDGRSRIAHDLRAHLASASWTSDSTQCSITLSTDDGARLLAMLTEQSRLCAALRLTRGTSVEVMLERIDELKQEIAEANETLAAWCPEVDPSRSSLTSTVNVLVGDVLAPLAAKQAAARRNASAIANPAAVLDERDACAQGWADAENQRHRDNAAHLKAMKQAAETIYDQQVELTQLRTKIDDVRRAVAGHGPADALAAVDVPATPPVRGARYCVEMLDDACVGIGTRAYVDPSDVDLFRGWSTSPGESRVWAGRFVQRSDLAGMAIVELGGDLFPALDKPTENADLRTAVLNAWERAKEAEDAASLYAIIETLAKQAQPDIEG